MSAKDALSTRQRNASTNELLDNATRLPKSDESATTTARGRDGAFPLHKQETEEKHRKPNSWRSQRDRTSRTQVHLRREAHVREIWKVLLEKVGHHEAR